MTLVRAVAVPIPSQEHRIEAYSCDICHCLAPGIGTLELHPAAELPSDDHLQPVVHGKPIRLDAAQPRGAKAHNRYALGSIGHGVHSNPIHGIGRAGQKRLVDLARGGESGAARPHVADLQKRFRQKLILRVQAELLRHRRIVVFGHKIRGKLRGGSARGESTRCGEWIEGGLKRRQGIARSGENVDPHEGRRDHRLEN